MEDIFFHHILPCIEKQTIHDNQYSLLCKHKYLQQIQKEMNIRNSAKLLNERFWNNQLKHVLHIFLDEYTLFIKYMVEILLNDLDVDISTEMYHYNKYKMKVPKFVISSTIIEYDSNDNISHMDFTMGQQIIEDAEICSTYRLGIVQKKILLDNYPYAKALIY